MTHGKKTIVAEPPILYKCPTYFPSHSRVQFTAARKTTSAKYINFSLFYTVYGLIWLNLLKWSCLLRHKLLVCMCIVVPVMPPVFSQKRPGYAREHAECCCVSVLSFFHCLASGKASDKGVLYPYRSLRPRGKCACVQSLHCHRTHSNSVFTFMSFICFWY